MKREIKFRAWSKVTSNMLYNAVTPWSTDKDYNIMQYTGLKDKNGKEIYEGDMVVINTISDKKRYVEYDIGSFWYCLDGGIRYEIREFKSDEIEIIGNIHQNPELLNK